MTRELEIIGRDYSKQDEKLKVKYPLYINNYLEIIKIFLKINEKRKRYEAGQYNGEDELGQYHMDPHDMGNAITIVGKRGSGKTTVMQEIRSILKKFNMCKKDWFNKIGEPYASELNGQIDNEFMVEAMEIIDASVLEEKDDLLEIILWHMYEQVRKRITSGKNAGLTNVNSWELDNFTKSVDEVYRMHQSIKGKRQEETGESVVTLLENMPNSIRTRHAMGKLIEAYFKIMCPGKEKSAYLLIPIDDLDLNIRKGYQMLEEIRRYLLDWKIIVLLTVDYEQMEKVCEAHFRKEFESRQCGMNEDELSKHISDLSDCYMNKVFPISHRIHLTEKSLKVSFIKEMDGDEEKTYKIKEYLLIKIAEKMGIYYDAFGLKTHFCVPNTVRELLAYIHFSLSLNSIDWNLLREPENQEDIVRQLGFYEQNHERFDNDIAERMVFQILKPAQRIVFEELRKRDLERRVGYVLQCYENTNKKKKVMEAVEEREHYSFGEFLGCIYRWGRDNYAYKPLVHCLLASFTSEMTREYINYRFNCEDKDSRDRSQKRLVGYIGDNIAAGWLAEGFGKIDLSLVPAGVEEGKEIQTEKGNEKETGEGKQQEKKNPSLFSVAYLEGRNIENFSISFPIEKDFREGIEGFLQLIEYFEETKILLILEALFLCMNNFRTLFDGKTCTPDIQVKIGQDKNGRFNIIADISKAVYFNWDILGFVKQSLDYHTWIKNIEEPIVNQLVDCARDLSRYSGRDKRCVNTIENFKGTSAFFDKESKWELALPLYDLDLSYNVLKRVRRACKEDVPAIKFDDILIRINNIYLYIERELLHEEERYIGVKETDWEFRYVKTFQQDPYIVTFRRILDDEKSKRLFLNQIHKIYMSLEKGDDKIESKESVGKGVEFI